MTAPTFPRTNALTARALMRLVSGQQFIHREFHGDNKTGSFCVNLTIEAVKCFNCRIACGDVISFTMALYVLQFVEDICTLIAQA